MRLYAAFAHLSGGVVYDGYLKIYSKNAYIGGPDGGVVHQAIRG
jgi:hypothetical protein